MPHILDLSGAHEALFHLRHLAAGSREYCRRGELHCGDRDYTPGEWAAYQGFLSFLASRSLLSLALNLRVLHDTARTKSLGKGVATDIEEISNSTEQGLGTVLQGDFELTLRESCNKIIHATEFRPEFKESRTGRPVKRYAYWTGQVTALGSQGRANWVVQLDTLRWCDAVDEFFEYSADQVEWY